MRPRVGSAINNDYGPWKEVKKPLPWSLFFKYRELKTESSTYFERTNRLDAFFDWICMRLSR